MALRRNVHRAHISATPNCWTCHLLVGQHSASYNIIGQIAILQNLPFSFCGTTLSQRTPEAWTSSIQLSIVTPSALNSGKQREFSITSPASGGIQLVFYCKKGESSMPARGGQGLDPITIRCPALKGSGTLNSQRESKSSNDKLCKEQCKAVVKR